MLIRPVIRQLIRPLVRLPTERGAGSIEAAVRRIFASGVDGYWRDPADLSTSYQDSAGITAGAVDSAVGLMLDKSDGAVSGAELVSNSEFTTSDLSYWTDKNAAVTATGNGVASLDYNSAYAIMLRRLAVAPSGTWVEVIVKVNSLTRGGFDLLVNNTTGAVITAAGTYRVIRQLDADGRVQLSTANCNAVIDYVSVRTLPGNHTTQSTGGSRPLLKLVSGYYGDQFDGLDDYVTASSGGGGSAGFFYCAAVYVGGGAGTSRALWSDRGTNTGYGVAIGSDDKFYLVAGDGAASTSLGTAAALSVGTAYILTAWDDGTNLNVQINNGTVASTARPSVSAGTSGFTEGRANGVAGSYFNGRIGVREYFKNYSPDAATREQIKRFIATRAGVSL
jgi:hypothetical protein